jgi:predicted amidohydrolase
MKIACHQFDVAFGRPTENVERIVDVARQVKREGTDLLLLPEACLTGYCVSCAEEAESIALPRSSEYLEAIRLASEELDMLIAFGFAEAGDGKPYNSAVLLEPGREPRFYRKTHLPELGLDRHVEPGRELPVFETRLGKIGILICFDLRVPEAARVLALRGAQLILLPTNWPQGSETSAEHVAITRAAENRVFLAACNRVGEENGFRFIGRSKIIHPSGQILAGAGTEEETIMAECDLAEALLKRNVFDPGRFETTVFDCRQPDLYQPLGQA